MKKKIKIAGAGIAGLTAAINLAKAGHEVEVFERSHDVGTRFNGDCQGIQNWFSDEDISDFLKKTNIKLDFEYKAADETYIWVPEKFKKNFKFSPLYYLIRRGNEKGFLDYSLKEQALSFDNIKIFFNHSVNPKEVDIVATGPVLDDPHTDVLAAGITFETEAKEQAAVALNEKMAKDGYSYFFIWQNRGTIATCIFNDFKRLNDYKKETVKFFKEKYQLDMKNIRNFSGMGNFFLPNTPKDKKIYIGEAGGFQDFLWGFGIRYAMESGYYAALSITENRDFYKMVNEEIFPKMKCSVVNRFLFMMLNDKGYELFMKSFVRDENFSEKKLIDLYELSFFKSLLLPLAKFYYRKNIRDPRKLK